jgi:hypothetical protein
MNPGVQTTIITVVLWILVVFGWGARTLADGRVRVRTAALLLLGYLLLAGRVWQGPWGVKMDLGGVLLPLVLAVWALVTRPSWNARGQWVLGLMTIASVNVVLMTLVPLDPAFFPLSGGYLYPVVSALLTVMSVRKPLAAVAMAVSGIALGAWVDPLIHERVELRTYLFGGPETRDLMTFAALAVLVTHGMYQAAARYVQRVLKNRGRREGGPEHV